jgi:hypothetical protein
VITRNAIQCKRCKQIIESKSVHDFRWCKCGAVAVDGGHDYLRRLYDDITSVIELSEDDVMGSIIDNTDNAVIQGKDNSQPYLTGCTVYASRNTLPPPPQRAGVPDV